MQTNGALIRVLATCLATRIFSLANSRSLAYATPATPAPRFVSLPVLPLSMRRTSPRRLLGFTLRRILSASLPLCTLAAALVITQSVVATPASAQRTPARTSATAPAVDSAKNVTADLLQNISLRSIGPGLVTGRIADIKIDPNNNSIWYVASAFGGLWKTTNRGTTFTPIFDEGGATNLCCIVIDPKNSEAHGP